MSKWNIKQMLARHDREEGFTLLEILVALALLGIAIAMILQLFAAGTRALSASEDYLSASLAGEARLRQIVEAGSLVEAAWQEVDSEGHRIDVAVVETLKDRTEGLSVRVFDISVMLHWNWGSKNRQLTLRTLKTIDKAVRSGEAPLSGA
jgi:prepilin-type N-terminal cleavage/methylation domain-containing protein